MSERDGPGCETFFRLNENNGRAFISEHRRSWNHHFVLVLIGGDAARDELPRLPDSFRVVHHDASQPGSSMLVHRRGKVSDRSAIRRKIVPALNQHTLTFANLAHVSLVNPQIRPDRG